MRTTLTLDDDVAAKLAAKARKTGRPFKQIVNETIRTGLALEARSKKLAPFKIEAAHLFRLKPGYNYDKVEELFDELDGPRRLR
ncbi:MAG: ribbon-helix-helix protein, CopG family [Candidatus Eremiobacteraeota bacterium]|nr:ribbon-helix-helix protein, CopG family [Candidatus Eremiobacteraeota bacterium]MBV8498478.1 ribbon-helix-helix protein, CopG family [Candidatus Eremiobacteraeota bacterium]